MEYILIRHPSKFKVQDLLFDLFTRWITFLAMFSFMFGFIFVLVRRAGELIFTNERKHSIL